MAPAWQLSRDVAVSAVPSAANSRAGSRASLTSAAASAASASAEALQAPAAKQARRERAGGAKRKDHNEEGNRGGAEEPGPGDEVLEVLVKAVLQVSQQSRAMAACLWTTFVVPLSWGR